jgi:hypothetical protein
MNIERLILASVSRKSVYRRLAALSDEEKQQVVEKVKQKLKEKYPESDTAEPTTVSVPVESDDDAPPEAGDDDIRITPVSEPGDGDVPADEDELVNPDDLDFGDDDKTDEEGSEPTGESEDKAPESDELVNPDDLDWGDADKPAEKDEDADADAAEDKDADEGEDEDEKPAKSDKKDDGEKEEKPKKEDAGGEVTATPEEDDILTELQDDSDEADDDDGGDEGEEPEAEIPADEGSPAGDIVDEIEEDVEEIKDDGKLEPGKVLDLFDSIMKLHTLLLHAKLPRNLAARRGKTAKDSVADRLVVGSIADRLAGRGLQLHRKDKDVICDGGGSSKGMDREPEFKPSRTDVKKPFRSKDKPADERDPDTDNDPDKRKD